MDLIRIAALFMAASLACPTIAGAQSLTSTVTIDVHGADLDDVLRLIGSASGENILPDATTPNPKVTLTLRAVTARMALNALETIYNLTDTVHDGYIIVSARSAAANVPAQRTTLVYPIDHASAVVALIQRSVPTGVSVTASPDDRSIVLAGPSDVVSQVRTLVASLTVNPPVNATYGLANVLPSVAIKEISTLYNLPSSTAVVADDTRHNLYVRGDQASNQQIAQALAIIDKPIPQVTYEVRVLDVTPTNDQSNVGVLWGGLNSQGQPTTGSAFTTFANRTIPINATINALIEEGKGSILAEPRISVEDGQKGSLLVGTSYPIVITNTGLVGGTQVQFVQIGVLIAVQPTVGADGSITSDLTTTYSEITGQTPIVQYPIIGTRTATSRVRVQTGDSIVLGGLYSDVSSETVARIPWLSQIPILGEFFKNKAAQRQKDEIVFVLTPHVGLDQTDGFKGDMRRIQGDAKP